jgi:hypothetical protein
VPERHLDRLSVGTNDDERAGRRGLVLGAKRRDRDERNQEGEKEDEPSGKNGFPELHDVASRERESYTASEDTNTPGKFTAKAP